MVFMESPRRICVVPTLTEPPCSGNSGLDAHRFEHDGSKWMAEDRIDDDACVSDDDASGERGDHLVEYGVRWFV